MCRALKNRKPRGQASCEDRKECAAGGAAGGLQKTGAAGKTVGGAGQPQEMDVSGLKELIKQATEAGEYDKVSALAAQTKAAEQKAGLLRRADRKSPPAAAAAEEDGRAPLNSPTTERLAASSPRRGARFAGLSLQKGASVGTMVRVKKQFELDPHASSRRKESIVYREGERFRIARYDADESSGAYHLSSRKSRGKNFSTLGPFLREHFEPV